MYGSDLIVFHCFYCFFFYLIGIINNIVVDIYLSIDILQFCVHTKQSLVCAEQEGEGQGLQTYYSHYKNNKLETWENELQKHRKKLYALQLHFNTKTN